MYFLKSIMPFETEPRFTYFDITYDGRKSVIFLLRLGVIKIKATLALRLPSIWSVNSVTLNDGECIKNQTERSES